MGSSWRDTVRRRQAAALEAGTEEAQEAAERGELADPELDERLDAGASRVV